jgi:thioredoxin-like negative regulator of GroEL
MTTPILLAAMLSCAALVASAGAADPETTQTPAPPAPSPTEGEMSDTATRLELAKVLTYDKKYPEAIETYHQVLASEPDNIEAKIGLSEVLYWTGKSDEAAAVLKDVPEDKLDDSGKLMLADLLVAKKDYPSAVRIFTTYLNKKPDDWSVRLKLAEVQSWTKDYPEAIANYELILKARPKDRQVRRKYGMVLSWAGQNEKATEQLRESLNP